MSYFLTIPQGFFTANELINDLPAAVVTQMIDEAISSLGLHQASVSSQKYQRSLGADAPQLEEVESCVNAVSFIVRAAISDKAADLGVLLKKHTCLSPEMTTLFVDTWSARSKDGQVVIGEETVQKALQLGKLVGFDWKLGVGVASSHCKSLGAPFVAVEIKIKDSAGEVRAYPMELNLDEFQAFAKTFRDISQQLDTV